MDYLKLRTEKGYTQATVARAVGCSVYSYQLWEKGVTTPKPDNQAKLKKVLGSDNQED